MVARSRHTGPRADRLRRLVLRIRQPANTGLVLNELAIDARAPPAGPFQSGELRNAMLRVNLGTPRRHPTGAVTLGRLRARSTRVRLEFLFSWQECNFHEACRKQRSCNLCADTFFSHCCYRSCSRAHASHARKAPPPRPSNLQKRNSPSLSRRTPPQPPVRTPLWKPNNSVRSAKFTTQMATWMFVTKTPVSAPTTSSTTKT